MAYTVIQNHQTCRSSLRVEIPSVYATSAGLFCKDNKMKTIPLTQEQFAIVDDEDFDWLNKFKWCAEKNKNTFYAARGRNKKRVLMHREILNPLPKMQIDHRNGNGLDNRRYNLRVCTDSENKFNQTKRGCLFRYKGVRLAPKSRRWEARIQFNKKRLSLGLFIIEIDAALAYDKKAKELFGEFARTNF